MPPLPLRTPRSAVVALAVLLVFWYLGGHDLWAPDEPYFAEGAREMLVDGEWWVPHVNGVVTTDKPPLFFWSIALASLPGGEVTPWTARLPSALAGLATLLLVLRLGRRLGGERTAWLAGLVLSTTLLFWAKARWAQTDALLCLLVWVALSAFEAFRAGDVSGRRAGLVFWGAASLAVLDKGPVGLLLPLGVALVVLALDRRLGAWRRFAPLAGPLVFFTVVGTWAAAATLGSGGEYSVWGALREHFFERGIHGMHHRQPPWYYLEVLPVQLLPWSGLVPGALLLAWRRRDAGDRFLAVAALFVVVFFSISTEKRDLYVLPAVPAFALLVGRLGDALWPRAAGEARAGSVARAPVSRRWLLAGQAVAGGLFVLVGAGLPIVAYGHEQVPAWWLAATLAVPFLAGGLATLGAVRRGSVPGALLAPAAAFAVAYLFVAAVVFPAMEPRKSARPFAERLAAETAAARAAGERVATHGLGNLPEAFAFYSDGVYTLELGEPEEVARHLARPGSWAAIDRGTFERLPPALAGRLEAVAADRLARRDVLLVRSPGGASPVRDSAVDAPD